MSDRRDPLVNPKSGDIVRSTVNGLGRQVVRVDGGDIYYKPISKAGRIGPERICWISTWQEWCRAQKAIVENQEQA